MLCVLFLFVGSVLLVILVFCVVCFVFVCGICVAHLYSFLCCVFGGVCVAHRFSFLYCLFCFCLWGSVLLVILAFCVVYFGFV